MSNEVGSDGLVKDSCYSKAINLTYKTALNNLCLLLYYPKWDGKDESISDHAGMLEDEMVQTHMEQLHDLKNVLGKLNYFEQNKYTYVKPEIEKEARKDFKIAMENELSSLYKDYKEQFNPELPWNYSVVNRYMETYDKVFGREELMRVPAVRSFKNDYEAYIQQDFSKQKSKSNAITKNDVKNGLLLRFAETSNNVGNEPIKEFELNLNRSDTSLKV